MLRKANKVGLNIEMASGIAFERAETDTDFMLFDFSNGMRHRTFRRLISQLMTA